VKRPTPTVEELIQKAGGVEAIVRSSIEDRASERKKYDFKIKSCKNVYFMNKGLLPTKDQISTLKQDIARSRQMVQEMIKEKFPSFMQQKLLKAVEDADFVVPPTVAEFETSFADSIRQKLAIQKLNSTSIKVFTARYAPDHTLRFYC
jgi:citrate synthase